MEKQTSTYFSSSVLQQAADLYGLEATNFRLIRENSNLIFDGGDRILRLTHSSLRGTDDIRSELDWILFLNERQLPVVQIVNSLKGLHFERVVVEKTYFTVVCFVKIKGNVANGDLWGKTVFTNLGKLVGQLHRVTKEYQAAAGMKTVHWDEIVEAKIVPYLPKDHRMLAAKYQAITKKIQEIPKREDNYGLVHYDIHYGNFLVDEQQAVILFDFEMACHSWYINDIAIVLYYALIHPLPEGFDKPTFVRFFLRSFMKGYQEENTLDTTEFQYLRLLLEYRDFLIYGYLHKVWDIANLSVSQKRYLEKLGNSIEEGYGFVDDGFMS